MVSDKELKAFEKGIVKTILGKPCNRHTPEEREKFKQWEAMIDSRSAKIPITEGEKQKVKRGYNYNCGIYKRDSRAHKI